MLSISERAAAYLERMPPAIAGSGGHAATFNAAAVLTRGFAMPEADALPLLLSWNQTHCQPSWSEADIRRKLRSAATSTRPLGYLLKDAETLWTPCASGFASDDEKKARQRESWPTFRAPTLTEIETISRLRHLPGSALRTAADAGLLRVGNCEHAACYILTEGHFAQARRLDGLPLPIKDGVSKAKNLPGAVGAFIGASLLGEVSNVLLVEGCIGLLEALGSIALADAQGWTAIAATSASSRFHRAPDLLARLKGRRVRIVPDGDEAGLEAAATWLAAMDHAGAFPDAIELPPECKDLGPIISDSLRYQPFLTTLFQ
jgi:hypothetical protein